MNLSQEEIMSGSLPRAAAGAGDAPSPGGVGTRDQVLPAGRIEPAWLSGGEGIPTGEEARRLWLECLKLDPWGGLELHPGWALDPRARAGGAPIISARWNVEHGEAASLGSLAVLRPRAVRMRPIPGLTWKVVLRGLRLEGGRVLGDNGPVPLAAFIGDVTRLLAAGDADCLLIEDLERGSPLWDALDEAGRGRDLAFFPYTPQPRWWIDFPEVPGDYWKKFSSKTRNTLRRRLKKIGASITRYAEESEVPTLLEKAHHVSKRTWQNRRLGLRIKDSPEERAFYAFAASCGALRSYILEREGRPCAFLMGIQWKGRFKLQEIGYDEADAKYAPGTVLLFQVLEDIIAHETPRSVDFGPGDYDYKQLFGDRHTYSGRVLLVRRSWRPMVVARLDQFRGRAHQGLRDYLRNIGVFNRLKKIYHKMPRLVKS